MAQDGSRWIHERPSGEEVAKWFADNVPLHEGMNAEDYVGGVTLIPAKERVPKVGGDEEQILTFTPYAKVETRVRYFWDWCRHNGYEGSIVPSDVPRLDTPGYHNEQLPPGFFFQPIKKQDDRVVTYVGCSMRVEVWERGDDDKLTPIMRPPAGTKAVPLLTRYGDDPNALMKAETGAIGRALGVAGMLILPGSGVATAEDMTEALSHEERGSGSTATADLPPVEQAPAAGEEAEDASSASSKDRFQGLTLELESEDSEKADELDAWLKERKADRWGDWPENDSRFRPLIRRVEKLLADARG